MSYIRNVFDELIIKFVSPRYKDARFLIPHSSRHSALSGRPWFRSFLRALVSSAIRMPATYISKKLPWGNKAFCILARSNDVGIFRDESSGTSTLRPVHLVRIYEVAAHRWMRVRTYIHYHTLVEAETFAVSRG